MIYHQVAIDHLYSHLNSCEERSRNEGEATVCELVESVRLERGRVAGDIEAAVILFLFVAADVLIPVRLIIRRVEREDDGTSIRGRSR